MIAEWAVCLTCHWNSRPERVGPDGGAEQTGNPSKKGIVLSVTPEASEKHLQRNTESQNILCK